MTAPKPPLAVRLARLADPSKDWQHSPNEDPEWDAAVWDNFDKAAEEKIPEECGSFELQNLNDLALAEQRVVEAGLGQEYIYYLTDVVLAGRRIWENEPERRLAVATATASQRAAALEAVLDSHPELERPR